MECLITGATGFIAQHITKTALEQGYVVIGTVRSASKGQKLQDNFLSIGLTNFSFEVVPDITADDAFHSVFENHPNIAIVAHTASPFLYDVTDPEKELIIPAVKGTENILNAIKDHIQNGGNIKRVIITSSDAALYSANDEQDSSKSFDEESWNEITYEDAKKDAINAYYGAKTFAERTAWRFAKHQENQPFPPLTVINPVYVFGPQTFDEDARGKLNTSNQMIKDLFDAKDFTNDKGGFVDVRDVATAHVMLFESSETIGKRLYMTNGKFSVQMILDVIREKFPDLAKSVPRGTPGSGPNDIQSLAKTSNEKTRAIIGDDFIPLEKTVVDIVAQINPCTSKFE